LEAILIDIADFVATWRRSPFAIRHLAPWEATTLAEEIISECIKSLPDEFVVSAGVALHRSAHVESGSVIKGPAIIGENAFVAATAYLRGGVYIDRGCIIGPACELKTAFMFEASKVAHLSFVGDAIIGAGANIEAGAIIANYRNEMDDKRIRIVRNGETIDTGVEKFGALIGDGVRIGANAVIAPGAIIDPRSCVPRLGHVDQHPAGR
jgi:NDP-sugar pyrophosphorylase family protein